MSDAPETHWQRQVRLNERHRLEPQPGDYWTDHLVGILVVLAVTDDAVVICRTKQELDTRHWEWNLGVTERMRRDEFAHYLTYASTMPSLGESHLDRCWADVSPERHLDTAQDYARRGEPVIPPPPEPPCADPVEAALRVLRAAGMVSGGSKAEVRKVIGAALDAAEQAKRVSQGCGELRDPWAPAATRLPPHLLGT